MTKIIIFCENQNYLDLIWLFAEWLRSMLSMHAIPRDTKLLVHGLSDGKNERLPFKHPMQQFFLKLKKVVTSILLILSTRLLGKTLRTVSYLSDPDITVREIAKSSANA